MSRTLFWARQAGQMTWDQTPSGSRLPAGGTFLGVYCLSLQWSTVFLAQPGVTCTLQAGIHIYVPIRWGFQQVNAFLTLCQLSADRQRETFPIPAELTNIGSSLPSSQLTGNVTPWVTPFRARPDSSNDVKCTQLR